MILKLECLLGIQGFLKFVNHEKSVKCKYYPKRLQCLTSQRMKKSHTICMTDLELLCHWVTVSIMEFGDVPHSLNPFSPGILWKIGIKKKKTKNATWSGCISKARANSKSKLTFLESSFNFLQKRLVFCMLYLRGYTAGGSALYNPRCCSQRLAGLKELRLIWESKLRKL